MSPDLKPPAGGQEAPRVSAPLRDDGPLDLLALADEICRRYGGEFPDEQGRYGPAGQAWCVHDNQHLLNWAVDAANADSDMREDVGWLASVLEARDFPLPRLARGLSIGADVVRERVAGASGELVAAALADAAEFVGDHGGFGGWFVG